MRDCMTKPCVDECLGCAWYTQAALCHANGMHWTLSINLVLSRSAVVARLYAEGVLACLQLHWSTANYQPLQERALWDGLAALYDQVHAAESSYLLSRHVKNAAVHATWGVHAVHADARDMGMSFGVTSNRYMRMSPKYDSTCHF